ncbi:hypothetical protein [Erythrobacter aureus]|uniref:Uncharacterized protein n=1 Tax=Erythrobacter aureus TaxID=2182384 RepID=A0A345YIS9_9SPHN|nr:hypothetical protein [Erythrobacter aureus]AXK43831.1 hypothetical protein DVR09_15355 [Erythrobacter aureus]
MAFADHSSKDISALPMHMQSAFTPQTIHQVRRGYAVAIQSMKAGVAIPSRDPKAPELGQSHSCFQQGTIIARVAANDVDGIDWLTASKIRRFLAS